MVHLTMRLTQQQKDLVISRRPGASLVRLGTEWSVVWQEPDLPVRERWRGQLIGTVVGTNVWWIGPEVFARTRRDAVEQLKAVQL